MNVLSQTLFSPKGRAWIYGVCTAFVPLLVFYGVATSEEAALWLAVAGSLLSTGTALAHIDTGGKVGKHVRDSPPGAPERTAREARPHSLEVDADRNAVGDKNGPAE